VRLKIIYNIIIVVGSCHRYCTRS